MGRRVWLGSIVAVMFLGSGIACAQGALATLTTWTVPTPHPMLAGLVLGPGGEVYFSEYATDRLGRLDPGSGTITEWPVGTGPNQLALAPSGAVYFTETGGNAIARLIPSHSYYTSEVIPTPGSRPEGIALTGDGTLQVWFAERDADKLGRATVGGLAFDVLQVVPPSQSVVPPETTTLTPTSSTVTPQFAPGNPALPPAIAAPLAQTSGPFTEWNLAVGPGRPRQLAVAPDGSIWISTETRSLIRFLPDSNVAYFHDLPSGSVSVDVAVDPVGNVWFTEGWKDKIGVLDPATGDVVEWKLAGGSQPYDLVLAPDGSIWFTERNGDRIGRLEPWTNTITEYQLAPEVHPLDIAIDAFGDVWFISERQGFIGRLSLGPALGEPPTGLPIVSLTVDRGCGADYFPGDSIAITVSVSDAASVTLIDFETSGDIKQIALGTLSGGGTRTITATVEGPAGLETLVAVARTVSGVYVSTACTFAVGGVSPSLVSISLDRGCDGTYHYGDTAATVIQSGVTGTVNLYNVTRDGRVTRVLSGRPIAPGMPVTLTDVSINPTTGRSTLVVQVVTSGGQVLTAACSLNVIP